MNFKEGTRNRWGNMMARCYDSDSAGYKNYGGRGIFVVKEWHEFENYAEDLKKLPNYGKEGYESLDRIDNDGPYSPDNCRWATFKMQRANQRPHSTQRKFKATSPEGVEYISDCQAEFAREHNLDRSRLSGCLNNRTHTHNFGWTAEFIDGVCEEDIHRSNAWFEAVSPSGEVYTGNSQIAFADEHGLTQSGMNKCLYEGQLTTGGGWTVRLLDEEEIDRSEDWFEAVSPDGEVYISNNIHKFSRRHKLRRYRVQKCLDGERGTHRGWTFECVDEPASQKR